MKEEVIRIPLFVKYNTEPSTTLKFVFYTHQCYAQVESYTSKYAAYQSLLKADLWFLHRVQTKGLLIKLEKRTQNRSAKVAVPVEHVSTT